jgi:hypothetical protein
MEKVPAAYVPHHLMSPALQVVEAQRQETQKMGYMEEGPSRAGQEADGGFHLGNWKQ